MEKDSEPEASDSRPEKPDEHQLIVWLVAAASPGEGLIEEFVVESMQCLIIVYIAQMGDVSPMLQSVLCF